MSRYVDYTVEQEIALVILDAEEEGVNILNEAFLEELEAVAGRLREEKGLEGVVVTSAKKKGFIAGADIRQIEQVTDPSEGAALAARGQRIFAAWAALPVPVVAAVHGHCLGGGTEFILACHYRIASPDAQIGLPEVKLGILPGFGGTQRLPRLISVEKALGIVLTGRTVKPEEALELGLLDRIAPVEGLEHEAIVLAREAALDAKHLHKARSRKQDGLRNWLLEGNPLGRSLLFRKAMENTRRKTSGHYPAPLEALEVIRKGLETSMEEGLRLEAEALGRLVVTPECKNLVHIFHLSQRPKKGPGIEASPAPVKKAAVLGAGVMGGGIAQLFAEKGIPVLLKDIDQDAVDAGIEHARTIFDRGAAKKGTDPAEIDRRMAMIQGTTSYDGVEGCDLVVEAVVEKMPVKQTVLKEIEPRLKESAVFATNTSALSVTELQGAAGRPEQVGGMHFFNPVHRMPLVEVVRGERTSDAAAATIFAFALKLGKTPIVVADRPGFLVNRLLGSYLNEACILAREGVDWRSLDTLAIRFGMPMGPFRLLDEVGIDIAAEVAGTLGTAFDHLQASRLFEQALKQNLKGKKGGAGFYLYEGEKETEPNPELEKQLSLENRRSASESDFRRLLLLMVNEAGRCLEEAVVRSPQDVDTGMVFGTGFPPFRGGLCRWADGQGLSRVTQELTGLGRSHGARFVPCEYIKKRKSFYAPPIAD